MIRAADTERFRLTPDETVAEGLRRAATDELRRAAEAFGGGSTDRAIHRGRTAIKKVRALLRLARPACRDAENHLLREAARRVAHLRDAHVMARTARSLLDRAGDADRAALRQLHAALARRARAGGPEPRNRSREVELFRSALGQAADRARSWGLPRGSRKLVVPGFVRTYRRARRSLAAARRTGSAHHLHEFRKRVKDHLYHVRFLLGLDEPVLQPRHKLLGQLADLLGEHHDLAVLAETVASDPAGYGGTGAVRAARRAIRQRQRELLAEIVPRAGVMFAATPSQLERYLRRQWRRWRPHG